MDEDLELIMEDVQAMIGVKCLTYTSTSAAYVHPENDQRYQLQCGYFASGPVLEVYRHVGRVEQKLARFELLDIEDVSPIACYIVALLS